MVFRVELLIVCGRCCLLNPFNTAPFYTSIVRPFFNSHTAIPAALPPSVFYPFIKIYTTMSTPLNMPKQMFEHINKWAIERKNCDNYIVEGAKIVWQNDYVEYVLSYCSYNHSFMMRAFNIEIVLFQLFYIPIGETPGFFDNIIQLVGHA